MKMIQNAGLMLAQGIPFPVAAQMSAVTGQIDGRVRVHDSSDLRVEHTRKNATDGLIRQTKSFSASSAPVYYVNLGLFQICLYCLPRKPTSGTSFEARWK
jgi:hypothetical protein